MAHVTAALTPDERIALESAQRDPSRRLGPLVVLRELGRGGMGQVLLAWDPRRGELVAVKTLLDRATGSARARLEREAKLLADLDHPGIAALHEAVFDGPGAPYLVMELVRGRPLSSFVDEDEPMEPRRAAGLVAELARAVGAAHARGVVHRDLKPQNVMLREDGRPVVLDFGLARSEQGSTIDLTRTGTVVGTLAYLAPEQIGDAKHADARADVYALGGILYTCLTGRVPFDGPAAVVLARVRVAAPPPPSEHVPGLDRALEALVMRCLEKQPGDRPAGAEEVARALDAWLAGTLTARSPSRAPLLLAAGGLAASTLLAVGLAVGTTSAPAPTPTPAPPSTQATVEPVEVPPSPPPEPVAVAPTPGPSADDVALAEKLLDRAVHMKRKEDQAAAEALCTRALELAPGVAHAHAQRGLHRYRQDDHRGAVEDYTVAVALEPRKALHQFNLGVNLAALGEREEARRAFDRALELDPRDASSLYSRSELSVAQGRLDEARVDLEACLALDPRDTRALASLGWLQFKRKDHVAAVEVYERAIALEPGRLVLRNNLTRNLILAGRGAEALRESDRTLERFPDEPDAWKERGFVRYQLLDLPGAISDLERALALAPGDAGARTQLRTLREELAARAPAGGAPAQARAEALRLLDRAKALVDGDPQVEVLCTRALELAPDLATAWTKRGYARFVRRDFAGAAADYREATRLEPRSALYHDNLSVNLSRAGDPAGALVALDRAVALDPAKGPKTRLERADLLIALERLPEAIATLEERLARAPDDPAALEKLGYSRFRARQHDEAVEVFSRLIRLQPDEAAHLANRAYNLLKLERLDEARRDAERAVALGPRLAESWHARGVVRLRQEDLAGAEADLARAFELEPEESTATTLREVRARLGR